MIVHAKCEGTYVRNVRESEMYKTAREMTKCEHGSYKS